MIPPIPEGYRRFAWVAWRAAALLIGLEFARRVSGHWQMPSALVGVSLVLWGVLGWKYAGYRWLPAFIAADVIFGAVLLWELPWGVAWFVPLWLALFSLPSILYGDTPATRGIARLNAFGQRSISSFSDRSIRLWSEALRITIVVGAGIWSMAPYLHDRILGGADATWYSSVIADTVEQWRLGAGPAFVGQTRFGIIGTVLPLRIAPYLQHLAVALDFATAHTLSPYMLLNLAVVLSEVGGGLSAYLCFRAILPKKRWEATLLSLLYMWCPAVIGLSYAGQLYMSEMTLPYLPIVFLGVVRIFDSPGFRGWAIVAAGCAACWLCHSPIGIWVTVSAGMAILARYLLGAGRGRLDAAYMGAALLLFVALCGYVFVSLFVLAVPPSPPISRDVLLGVVRDSVPAVFQPVSSTAGSLSDLQLGWSLWAILLIATVLAWRKRSFPARALTMAALLLACLALPIPWADRALWLRVPQAVVNATNAAPMQRIYPILAACAATLTASVLAVTPRRREWVLLVLGASVLWSLAESLPFRRRALLIANTKESSEAALSPDNFATSRYSYGLLGTANQFNSDGVLDYNLEQRVLGSNRRTYIVSNVSTIAPGYDFGRPVPRPDPPNVFKGTSPAGEPNWVLLSPAFTLQPGAHYLLAMSFPNNDYRGVIQIVGQSFHREYSLPMSGEKFAFGSGRFNSRVIPLSSVSKNPVELNMAFINQDPGADTSRFGDFARYDLIQYDPNKLPIRLKSVVPYVAEVRSPDDGWLETFRFFTPGWTAMVDGRPARIIRSWNGLVAVAISAGKSEVTLIYRPPVLLLTFYWLTGTAWAALIVCCLRGIWSRHLSSAGPTGAARPIGG